MKDFEFSKKTTEKIIKCFNEEKSGLFGIINNIMALSTIQKCWGNKSKIRIFKTFINEYYYAFYEDDNRVIIFDSEKEVYNFIFAL